MSALKGGAVNPLTVFTLVWRSMSREVPAVWKQPSVWFWPAFPSYEAGVLVGINPAD